MQQAITLVAKGPMNKKEVIFSWRSLPWQWALFAFLLVALLLPMGAAASPRPQAASATPGGQPVAIYFFWGNGCPHCAKAKPFLEELARKYPNVTLHDYEVWYVEENQALFIQMAFTHGFEPSGVPTIFIGDRYWVGYAEQLVPELDAAVASCSVTGCPDAGLGIIPGIPTPTPIPAPISPLGIAAAGGGQTGAGAAPTAEESTVVAAAPSVKAAAAVVIPGKRESAAVAAASDGKALGIAVAAATPAVVHAGIASVLPETPQQLAVPWLGMIDLAAQSLVVSTALIAFVDGFNPCSLWVLSVLLALTLNSGSRRKVFLVGFVFLMVTSLVYMAFITGLFTMFTVISFVGWIRIVVALVALFFAAVNIKDYFWYKEGISFTIADEKKPGIYRGVRRVLNAGESTWSVVAATAVLAAGVSLVEFSCTAGFPVLWTNLLITQQVTALAFVLLLLLYMVIYQLDELAIFLVAVFSLKASRLEEKQGRLLKLVGGMLMLTLAAVMLINPAWMNQISSSLVVFAIAFGGTGLVLLVHRVILPRWGIQIGSELAPASQAHSRKREPQQARR